MLAALAHGKTVLTNLLDSDDVRHMLNALTALGVSYTLSADRTRCEIIGNGGPLHAEMPGSCSSVTPERQCVRWRQHFAWVAMILY
nr:hypothetical protein [Escherichia coli]